MKIVEITNKKENNIPLTEEEINFAVNGFVFKSSISDDEMTGFLKAIHKNGMSKEELFWYTKALVESGDTLPLSERVDKHSTGGIGDKVSLALLPISMAMGMKMLKMSGRGLGFTGGTVDKFESFENFNTSLSIDEALDQTDRIGAAITGQTPNLTPADGKIYALRDVTGTVDSIPLIAASIMSKKIATGAKYIIIDLKVGSGAFMKNMKDAMELGTRMKEIGNDYGREVFIIMTSMDRPLGMYIGNGAEIKETVNFLSGLSKVDDVYKLLLKVSTELHMKSTGSTKEESTILFNQAIDSGKALEAFKTLVMNQGGNPDSVTNLSYFMPYFRTTVKTNTSGYIDFDDISLFGSELIKFRAGRIKKGDELYHAAGIRLSKTKGDYIEQYETLFTLYSEEQPTEEQLDDIRKIFIIKKDKVETDVIESIILGEIGW